MTPQVVPSLQGHHVSQVRGGQHHALALTQVHLPCCLRVSARFCCVQCLKSTVEADLHLVLQNFDPAYLARQVFISTG